MDGSRFEAWTRRQFGLAVSGGAATLLGLRASEDAAANKTHNRKRGRCRKAGQSCRHKGNCRNCTCCKGFICVDNRCV